MNVRRLNKMLDVLRIAQLGIDEGRYSADLFDLADWRVEKQCGTVCCACGLAAQTAPFIEEGFTMGVNAPEFKGRVGYDAVREFFDIPEHTAYRLFSASQYPPKATPGMVADRVEQLIKQELLGGMGFI